MNGWVILVDHAARFPQRGHPAQGHHHQRLPGAAETLRRTRPRQDHQPVALLQLSVQRLLRLAAGRGARPPHHPDRRDHARAARAQALRVCAARSAGGAQSRRAPRPGRPRPPPSICCSASACAGSALRGVRPAVVRLVSLPGDRSDHHPGQAMADRPPSPAHRSPSSAPSEAEFFRAALHQHTQRDWRNPRARTVAKYVAGGALRSARDAAALLDRDRSSTFRSSPSAIRSTSSRSPSASLAELAEFDGLFIRETTSIDNYTYRFARRAWQEGMPVIDDPVSMIRCTNKVYLHELMEAHQASRSPPTVMLAEDERPRQGREAPGLADGGEDPRRLVLARRAQGRQFRGAEGADRRAVRGHRPAAGAAIHADRVRLAGRRARRRAAVRLPVPDGARPLADHQARAGRRRARRRLSHHGDRRGAAARHRGRRCAPRARSAPASTASTSRKPATRWW